VSPSPSPMSSFFETHLSSHLTSHPVNPSIYVSSQHSFNQVHFITMSYASVASHNRELTDTLLPFPLPCRCLYRPLPTTTVTPRRLKIRWWLCSHPRSPPRGGAA
jgi:hypothetical protein